ncbi:MAG: MBL fold metallo-hydrolase [Geobacter sp.]
MIVTIHRGTHEIGGSCIEVRHADTRMVLDIGMPLLDANKERFDMREYQCMSGPELVAAGVLPNIRGFYRWDLDSKPVDALLISHAHLDHYGFAQYVREDVTCYLGEGTRQLMALSALYSNQGWIPTRFAPITNTTPVTVGTIQFTPFLVDHSAFDAYAFLLEAEGKRLLYSGDFRDHGRKPHSIAKMMRSVPQGIDALLIEGTMLERDDLPKTEQQIEDEFFRLCRSTSKMVLVAVSGQNVDRLVSIYRAAKRSNRMLVMDPYIANVLETLAVKARLPHPSPAFDDVKVYFPATITRKLKRLGKEDQFIKYGRFKMTPQQLSDRQSETVMLIRPSVLDYIKKLKNIDGAKVVWSQWGGYLSESYNKKLLDFIHEHGMELITIHTSGHASVDTLRNLVESVRPKQVIPIHTNTPERFSQILNGIMVSAGNDGDEVSL